LYSSPKAGLNAVPTVKITLGTPFPGVPARNDPCQSDIVSGSFNAVPLSYKTNGLQNFPKRPGAFMENPLNFSHSFIKWAVSECACMQSSYNLPPKQLINLLLRTLRLSVKTLTQPVSVLIGYNCICE